MLRMLAEGLGIVNHLYECYAVVMADIDIDDPTLRELLITRKKLEIRTWFLRMSIGLNIGLVTGFLVSIAVRP
jgi:hypothetical protein